MCGVAGYSLSPDVRINSKRITKAMLLAIEHRGRDATGFAFRDTTGAFQVHKVDLPASTFVKRRLCVPKQQRTVIMHTRWATQGAPEINENNHPILAGSVVGVHNGHINNDDYLFRAIEKVVGHNVRVAEVDSEAAFAVLGYIDQPVTESLEEITGGATLAWLDQTDADDILHLARLNSSPLVIARTTDGSLFFASTEGAVFDGVAAAGLWIEDMLDVAEGEYFTVQNGQVTQTESFTPARSYSYSGMGTTTYKGGTTTYRGGGSGDWKDEYEWQDGRLVRHGDLHEMIEANKRRQNVGVVGGVASVTSLSERLAAEVPDVTDVDQAAELDEWLALNQEWIDDLEARNREAIEKDDAADETAAAVKEMKQRVQWSRYPTVSTGFFDVEHVIPTPDETSYLGEIRYQNRANAIEKFCENMTDKARLDSSHLLKGFARPGDAVKCKIEKMEFVGHIVSLPETFPHGEYVLRVYALNDHRKHGHEAILVSKPYWEFTIIGPGDKIRDLADMSAALKESSDA